MLKAVVAIPFFAGVVFNYESGRVSFAEIC